jgi:O-antigen ligase
MISAISNKQATIKTLRYSFLAFAYLALIIILSIGYGLTPTIFSIFVLIAAIFILPSHGLGFGLIILLTMTMERFFTLTPLVIGGTVYKLYLLDITIGLTALALIIASIKKRTSGFKLNWPEVILLIWVGFNIFSFSQSLLSQGTDFAVAFSTLKNYTFYPLLYFLTKYSISSAKQLKNYSHLFFLGGLLIIPFIVIGIISGQGLWTEFTPLSTVGFRLLAGTHAYYLCIATIFATSLLVFKKFWNTPIVVSVILIWLFGIAGSLMRHLWIALLIALTSLFILLPTKEKLTIKQNRKKIFWVTISVIAVLALVISLMPNYYLPENISSISNRLTSFTNITQDSSANWRIQFWQSAYDKWQNQFLLGTGLGQNITISIDNWQTVEEIRSIHNSHLSIIIQTGIIGFSIFIASIISIIVYNFKAGINNLKLKPYYLAIIATLVMILVATTFQPHLETNLTGIFFWILLGMLSTPKKI